MVCFSCKRGKVVSSGGMYLPNGDRIRDVEKDEYKYLEILEYDKIKESKMKERFRREWRE